MRKFTLITSCFFLFFLWGCQSEQSKDYLPDGSDARAHIETFDESVAIPGKIMVKLRQEPADEQNLTRAGGGLSTGLVSLDDIAASIGAYDMTRVFPPAGKFEARSREAGLHLWYVVEFDENLPVTRAATELAESEYIATIEPVVYIQRIEPNRNVNGSAAASFENVVRNSAAMFNDPYLPAQWHYDNDGSGNTWIAGSDARISGAWEHTTGHPDVIVAVVDGGIGYEHEDLAANMWINEAEYYGTDGVDDDGNGYADDIYGYNFVTGSGVIIPDFHGTHVAGTIAAVNNNGIGVSGIAGGDGTPNSGVRLMSCEIYYENIRGVDVGTTTVNVTRAIKYGADNGAVISQNSWGLNNYDPSVLSLFSETIAYFIKNAGIDENGNQSGPMKGGLVIFAAGNDGVTSLTYPAAIEGVVAVSATGPNYQPAYYTNYGTWVHIHAPGGDYYNGGGDPGLVLSTVEGYERGVYKSGYDYMQGTSMACPHVSGVAALYISKFGVGRPGLTPDMVKDALFSTAYQDMYERYPIYAGRFGVGGLDATAAIRSGLGTQEPQPPYLSLTFPRVVLKGVGTVKTISLDDYFTDPGGGRITYGAVVSPEGVVSILAGEGNLHFYAEAVGTATVEVTATNEAGLFVTEILNVICVEDVDEGIAVTKPGGGGNDNELPGVSL